MRPQLNPLILGPGAPWSLPGSSLDIQFTTGRAAVNRQTSSISSLLTTARASTGYAATSSGGLTLFQANIPRITDLGLLVEQAATNLALQSQTFDNAQWNKAHGGVASSPSITADQGTAPDGTLTADRGQFALNGGTTTSDSSDLTSTSLAVSNSTAYTYSIYLKSNTASSYAMQLTDADNAASPTAITVTPVWTRFSVTYTTTTTTARPNVRLSGGRTPTNSDSADILMWGAELKLGSVLTSYIPTTTVAVTRAADVITLAGAALALARPASGWLVAKLPQGASSQSYTLVRKVSPSDAYLFAQSSSVASALVASSGVANATIGAGGTFAGSVRYAVTWDGTGIANAANGGTVSSGATPFGATDASPMYLGSSGSGNNSINSYISRLAIGNTRLTNAQIQALAV